MTARATGGVSAPPVTVASMDDREAVLAVRTVAAGHVETELATCGGPAAPAAVCGCTAAVQSVLADLPADAVVLVNATPIRAGWLSTAPDPGRMAEFLDTVDAAVRRWRSHGVRTIAVRLGRTAGHLTVLGRSFGGVLYPCPRPASACGRPDPVTVCGDCIDAAAFTPGIGDVPEVWLAPDDLPLSTVGWCADTTVNLAVLTEALSLADAPGATVR